MRGRSLSASILTRFRPCTTWHLPRESDRPRVSYVIPDSVAMNAFVMGRTSDPPAIVVTAALMARGDLRLKRAVFANLLARLSDDGVRWTTDLYKVMMPIRLLLNRIHDLYRQAADHTRSIAAVCIGLFALGEFRDPHRNLRVQCAERGVGADCRNIVRGLFGHHDAGFGPLVSRRIPTSRLQRRCRRTHASQGPRTCRRCLEGCSERAHVAGRWMALPVLDVRECRPSVPCGAAVPARRDPPRTPIDSRFSGASQHHSATTAPTGFCGPRGATRSMIRESTAADLAGTRHSRSRRLAVGSGYRTE